MDDNKKNWYYYYEIIIDNVLKILWLILLIGWLLTGHKL
jgi:hypothetical protein